MVNAFKDIWALKNEYDVPMRKTRYMISVKGADIMKCEAGYKKHSPEQKICSAFLLGKQMRKLRVPLAVNRPSDPVRTDIHWYRKETDIFLCRTRSPAYTNYREEVVFPGLYKTRQMAALSWPASRGSVICKDQALVMRFCTQGPAASSAGSFCHHNQFILSANNHLRIHTGIHYGGHWDEEMKKAYFLFLRRNNCPLYPTVARLVYNRLQGRYIAQTAAHCRGRLGSFLPFSLSANKQRRFFCNYGLEVAACICCLPTARRYFRIRCLDAYVMRAYMEKWRRRAEADFRDGSTAIQRGC